MATPINFEQFREDFAEAVKDIETKHGIRLQLNGISYTDGGFTDKLSAVKLRGDKLAEIMPAKWFADTERLQRFYPEMHGKLFAYKNNVYAVAAWTKRSGFMNICLSNGGKNYITFGGKSDFERNDIIFYEAPVYNAAKLFPYDEFKAYHNVTKLPDGRLAIYVWDTRQVHCTTNEKHMIEAYDNACILDCVVDSRQPLKFEQ
jgi:hypothetical protein